MRKIKTFLASLLVSAISITTFRTVPIVADATPIAYAKLAYVDGNRVRVDLYLDNIPSFTSGGFHVELGSGFDVAYDPDFPTLVWREDTGTYNQYLHSIIVDNDPTTNGVFVYFAFSHSYPMILDAPLVSFYVYKNSSSTNTNSTASIVFKETNYSSDCISDALASPPFIYYGADIYQPAMSKSVDYVLGDIDGNSAVNSADVTFLNSALSVPPYSYTISSIIDTFTTYFPYAKDAYALDPNLNGTVSNSDAVAINQYIYQGSSYTGDIGKHCYHSYY